MQTVEEAREKREKHERLNDRKVRDHLELS